MDGTALREWRKAMGWSQAHAAEELGVSRETIVRWEAGATIQHDRMLGLACGQLKIAALFGSDYTIHGKAGAGFVRDSRLVEAEPMGETFSYAEG